MHQHHAKGLGVLTASGISGVPDFGLELECRIPNSLIEEKQARTDRPAGDPGLRIKQPILKVDIKVVDACEHSRRLPSREPVPGGYQAELAVKLAQPRFRQALDQCLAVLPFGPFIGDQQVPPSVKAVFESFASGNVYNVRLYDAPMRQSATHDIGGRNLDDRWRSWAMPCGAEAVITHDCASERAWLVLGGCGLQGNDRGSVKA